MIKMRTHCDCMVCCLAMLMDWTYEEAADYFPPKAVTETGYQWLWLQPYLKSNDISVIELHISRGLIKRVNWSRPSMVNVPSLTGYKGDHMIFWDGKKVIDPIVGKIKYKVLPDNILNIYQLKT